MTCTALAGAPVATTSSSSSGAPILPIVLVIVVLAAAGLFFFLRQRGVSTATDCSELRKRCNDLSAEAAAAQAKAQQAAAAAKAAQRLSRRPNTHWLRPSTPPDVASGPDQSSSWVEDPETGRRITELRPRFCNEPMSPGAVKSRTTHRNTKPSFAKRSLTRPTLPQRPPRLPSPRRSRPPTRPKRPRRVRPTRPPP